MIIPMETMGAVLLEQYNTIRKKPELFYSFAGGLRGAAFFVREVAVRHSDQALISRADEVIGWLDQHEAELEEESELEMDLRWQSEKGQRDVRKATSKAVKHYVGMEVEDERFSALVATYQSAFPTFLVRQSVYDRLHPKKHSASIRTHLLALIEKQRLGREPTVTEMKDAYAEALTAHEMDVLRYLDKALPGFDFHGIWLTASIQSCR